MRKFEIKFRIDEDLLATVISLLSQEVGHVDIMLVANGLDPTPEASPAPFSRPAPFRREFRPVSQHRTGTVILQALSQAPDNTMTISEMGPFFTAAGLAPTSASAAASGLLREGLIKRIARRTYTLVTPEPSDEA